VKLVTDKDSMRINATSDALGGKIGQDDDVQRLVDEIENGTGENKVEVACEVSVAFIRFAQDLKKKIKEIESRKENQ